MNGKNRIERMKMMNKLQQKWKGEFPLYSKKYDQWFDNRKVLSDFCYEYDTIYQDMQLYFTTPVYAKELDLDKIFDYYIDDIPEYYDRFTDFPEKLQELFNDLNKQITENKIILSYESTNIAAIFDEE